MCQYEGSKGSNVLLGAYLNLESFHDLNVLKNPGSCSAFARPNKLEIKKEV